MTSAVFITFEHGSEVDELAKVLKINLEQADEHGPLSYAWDQNMRWPILARGLDVKAIVGTLQKISDTMAQAEEIGGEWDEERQQIADIIAQLT